MVSTLSQGCMGSKGRDGIRSRASLAVQLVTLKSYSTLSVEKQTLKSLFPLTDPYSRCSGPSNRAAKACRESILMRLLSSASEKLHPLLGRGASSVNIDTCLRGMESATNRGATAAEI